MQSVDADSDEVNDLVGKRCDCKKGYFRLVTYTGGEKAGEPCLYKNPTFFVYTRTAERRRRRSNLLSDAIFAGFVVVIVSAVGAGGWWLTSAINHASHDNIYVCDRTYDETEVSQKYQTVEPAHLDYNRLTGKITVEGQSRSTSTRNLVGKMSHRNYGEYCDPRNPHLRILVDPCPYYDQCISEVAHHRADHEGKFRVLTYEEIVDFLAMEQ